MEGSAESVIQAELPGVSRTELMHSCPSKIINGEIIEPDIAGGTPESCRWSGGSPRMSARDIEPAAVGVALAYGSTDRRGCPEEANPSRRDQRLTWCPRVQYGVRRCRRHRVMNHARGLAIAGGDRSRR